MSDIIPQDPAIEALRERVRQLEAENEADTRRIAARTMCRDEFNEMIATLTRKLRPKKPRIVAQAEPAGRDLQDTQSPPAPTPISVFAAVPSNNDGPTDELPAEAA